MSRPKLYAMAAVVLLVTAAALWAGLTISRARGIIRERNNQLAQQTSQTEAARAQAELLAQKNQLYSIELDQLRTRPPEQVEVIRERVRTIYRDAPAPVADYLAGHRREISWTNPDGSVLVHVPDAISGNTVEVQLDTDKICEPWIRLAPSPPPDPDPPQTVSPIQIHHGELVRASARVGLAGYELEATTTPYTIGTDRHQVGLQLGARSRLERQGGLMTGEAWVGIEYRWAAP